MFTVIACGEVSGDTKWLKDTATNARKILEGNKIEGAVLITRIATGSVPDFLTGTGVALVVEDEPNRAAFGLGFLD